MEAVETQIEALQARVLELNKQRGRREIDAEQYNKGSHEAMEKLDALLIERDRIAEKQSAATLNQAYQEIVEQFLNKAKTQAEFDKDIFAQLVTCITIKSRDEIIYELKDGTRLKADCDGV